MARPGACPAAFVDVTIGISTQSGASAGGAEWTASRPGSVTCRTKPLAAGAQRAVTSGQMWFGEWGIRAIGRAADRRTGRCVCRVAAVPSSALFPEMWSLAGASQWRGGEAAALVGNGL